MGVQVQSAMIIDDDPDLVKLLGHILENRHIHALPVQSLQEAEECLNYLKPTIVFLDNSFPDGLGVNLIAKIHEADEEIKIIMITADSAAWIREKAMEQGIDYFLPKPLDKKTIDRVLDDLKLNRA